MNLLTFFFTLLIFFEKKHLKVRVRPNIDNMIESSFVEIKYISVDNNCEIIISKYFLESF